VKKVSVITLAILIILTGACSQLRSLVVSENQTKIDAQATSEASPHLTQTAQSGPQPAFPTAQSLEYVTLQVWEDQNSVSPLQPQEIHVLITDKGHPLANREPLITLAIPNSPSQTYIFPPTDENGRAEILVPPIEKPHGTIIPYEVCLRTITEETKCMGDFYLIVNP
jgi:hypothetical protein